MRVNVYIHVAKVTFDQWYESREITSLKRRNTRDKEDNRKSQRNNKNNNRETMALGRTPPPPAPKKGAKQIDEGNHANKCDLSPNKPEHARSPDISYLTYIFVRLSWLVIIGL